MFEIRVICDPTEADTVTERLREVFHTGPVRTVLAPSCDPDLFTPTRLYLTCEHRPGEEPDLTPEQAYHHAPPLFEEDIWARKAANDLNFTMGREYLIRTAALYDRIAVHRDHDPGDAEIAEAAALALIDADKANGDSISGPATSPRAYVRRAYADWRHIDLIEQGRCPNCGLHTCTCTRPTV